MTKDELIALAKNIATAHQLFPEVICGICERESSWDPWSIRYEPVFEVRYLEPLVHAGQLTNVTEIKSRAISWGLMQTIGQSIRELGYTGKLAMLCDPPTGIEWGCRLFTTKLGHAGEDYAKALLLWNGGGNPAYPGDVLAMAAKYK